MTTTIDKQSSTIEISQHYKSSTRIDSQNIDLRTFVNEFIVHGTAINVLDTISRELQNTSQRAFTITGPYGSGKSTIALFLSCLTSTDVALRTHALKKLNEKSNDIPNFEERFSLSNGWSTVKHVCGLESPAIGIIKSLLPEFDYKTEVHFESLTDEDSLGLIKDILHNHKPKSAKGEPDGLIILLDEMGKALDYQSRENKDLHFFQSLADIVQQSKTPVLLVGFLHQAFSDYAKNKDVKTQQEWSKVQGRYRDLNFNPSIDESLVLVGDSIKREDSIEHRLLNAHENLVKIIGFAFHEQNKNLNALRQTLPLDPIVSLLLGPVSRRRFSQNERSLFGFLASHEKFGFREFLETNYTNVDSVSLYTPEMYWHYLEHNLHHLIATSQDSKAWLEGTDAVYRATQKGTTLHIAITKVIALLTIFGFQHQLHVKKDWLVSYFNARGFSASDVLNAIKDLEAWTVIIYRQNHDALFVFQGSDIDINALITSKIDSISSGIDWTEVCAKQQSILATAHYHETGTMRWASTLLVNKLDKSLTDQLQKTPMTGEAFANFALCLNTGTFEQLSSSLLIKDYAIIGLAKDYAVLKNVAIELIALKTILKEEKKIAHDSIAKNELESRIKQAEQSVADELQNLYLHAEWHYCNEALSCTSLSSAASSVAERIYYKSPTLLNELVNRSKPSGSANSAIRKLMHAMLENGDEKDLGFDENTFPPEKGLYLSCLKSKGWHCETEEGFLFPSNWSKESQANNPKMHQLWLSGFDFIKGNSADKQVTLAELYDMWMKPPYGLTAGLCRIYGLALLKSLEGQVAFYDWDSTNQFIFIPELDEELVNKIYKYPKEAGVRYFEISEIQTHLLDNLAKATIGNTTNDTAILNIAKHIVGIVHKLPTWVKKTSGESFVNSKENGLTKEARDFRNKVIAANDPFKLILDDLPAVFGFSKNEKEAEEKLAQCLKTAIEDLSAQHEMLLSGFKQIIINMLNAEFNENLKTRAEFVEKIAKRPNVKELAKRISQFIDGKIKFEFIINLAAGVPEAKWTDKHLRSGLDELQNLCVQFRRIESFGSLQEKGTSKPLAFITTDKDGNHKEFGSFIKHDLEADTDVKSAVETINSTLVSMSKEQKLAALTTLLTDLMDQSDSEAIDD